jgi:hypothetical protein
MYTYKNKISSFLDDTWTYLGVLNNPKSIEDYL